MFDEIQNMATGIEIKDELEVDFTEITNQDFQCQNKEASSKIQNECDMIQNIKCDIEIKEELNVNFSVIANLCDKPSNLTSCAAVLPVMFVKPARISLLFGKPIVALADSFA